MQVDGYFIKSIKQVFDMKLQKLAIFDKKAMIVKTHPTKNMKASLGYPNISLNKYAITSMGLGLYILKKTAFITFAANLLQQPNWRFVFINNKLLLGFLVKKLA